MRTLLMLAVFAATSLNVALAKGPLTSLSLPFEIDDLRTFEPRLFQASNGNTLLLLFTKKEGLQTVVYDDSHKLVSSQVTHSKLWNDRDGKNAEIKNIFETNGKVNIFFQQKDGVTPVLYRLTIDPVSGKVVEEIKVDEMTKYWGPVGNMLSGQFAKQYFIEKDPESDFYAVVKFDPFARKNEYRIELMHYDGTHKEINRAFYDSQEGEHKYVNYLSMAVNGGREVFLCTYDYNTRMSGGQSSQINFSKLETGSKEFITQSMKSSDDLKNTTGCLVKIPGANVLQLMSMTLEEVKTKNYAQVMSYSIMLFQVDAKSMAIMSRKSFPPGKLTEYKRRVLKENEGFAGTPRGFIVNPNGSTTVLVEEMTPDKNVTHTDLFVFGALNMQWDKPATDGVLFRHSHGQTTPETFFAANERNKGIGTHSSFDCVSTLTGDQYFIYNENPENLNVPENMRKDFVRNRVGRSPHPTVPMCYMISEGVAEKSILVAQTPGEDDEDLNAIISTANYNPAKGIYAVVVSSRLGRKVNGKVAWVKL
jgi:hypothetical protein